MAQTIEVPFTSSLHNECPARIERDWCRRAAYFFTLVGALASAVAGAIIGFTTPEVECVLVDSPRIVHATSPGSVRFLLRNGTGRSVKLRARSYQCGVRLDGVPTELPPREAAEIRLVFGTAGLNGPHRFAAAISTDAIPRVLHLAADTDIYADWVVRRLKLGSIPSGAPVAKRIRIENVPAQRLVRIGKPTQHDWSTTVVSTSDRFVEIELAGNAPHVGESVSESLSLCDFDLFFSDADVRRVQVIATALVTPNSDHSASASIITTRDLALTAAQGQR